MQKKELRETYYALSHSCLLLENLALNDLIGNRGFHYMPFGGRSMFGFRLKIGISADLKHV